MAAAVMAVSANAQPITASFGSADIDGLSKDTEVVCPGFTIAGTYFAAGTSKVNVYNNDKGMKLRTNKNGNTIVFDVKPGVTITKLVMGAVTNDENASITLSGVAVDGVDLTFSPVAMPNTKAADGAAIVNLDGISAKSTITFSFSDADYTGKNKQAFVAGEVTYEEGDPAGIDNVTVAEDENAPMYNLQGVQVDENYKGIVIKNGKKYLNK